MVVSKMKLDPYMTPKMNVLIRGQITTLSDMSHTPAVYPSIESIFFPEYVGDVSIAIWHHDGVLLQIWIFYDIIM